MSIRHIPVPLGHSSTTKLSVDEYTKGGCFFSRFIGSSVTRGCCLSGQCLELIEVFWKIRFVLGFLSKFSDEKVVLGDKRRVVRLGLALKVADDLKLYFENLFIIIAVHRYTSEHGLRIRVGKETRS